MKINSAITISLVPEARGGPFVYWGDLAGNCRRAAAQGFQAVEIFAPGPEALEGLQSILESNNLRLAALGTGAGWVIHKWRLTDPEAQARKKGCEFIRKMIDAAAPFRASIIIGSMQGRIESGSRAEALGWLSKALGELGAEAGARGVGVLFEPLNRYETNVIRTVDEGLDLLNRAGSPNVKLLCDLFHMNIEEADLAGALKKAGSKLGHVHFVDSNRRAMGNGHIQMEPIIEAVRSLNFEGYFSAEALPEPDSDAAARQTAAALRSLGIL